MVAKKTYALAQLIVIVALCLNIFFLSKESGRLSRALKFFFDDVSNSEKSSTSDSSHRQMIRAVRSSNVKDLSAFFENISCDDEGLESSPNAASLGLDGENDNSFDFEAQSTMYMEGKATADDEKLIEANGRFVSILENPNSLSQDEETIREYRIVSQGPSILPQQTRHNFAVSQPATQTEESDIQRSTGMAKEMLVKYFKSIISQYERLSPVEKTNTIS